ncbi:MAG TPA: DUF1345 domain-containing protein [Candidatus Acidoferrales bacterium]|nr:DUF1345 domain-containing protein [Candidatus Acidoferrales bacterium]
MRARALLLHAAQLGGAVAIGAIVYALAPGWLHGMTRLIGAYDVAAIALLASYWVEILRTTTAKARARAGPEDPGRNLLFAIVLIAVVIGLYAAIQILGKGTVAVPHHRAVSLTLGLSAVVLGWLIIHTTFTFRYGRLYYGDRDLDEKSDGGLQFPGGEPPSDLDFAYFSFVVGMTFQVSDVQITSRRIRRVVLMHGVISFAYNTTILALVVNLVSNLLH